MKIFHLSDLHIGKIVNGYDMEEDQRYVFTQILEYVKAEQPEVVILAGDLYDKVIPSAKAVRLFDSFLTDMASENVTILAISGNHDSGERLNFASEIMKKQNVYIKGTFDGAAEKVVLNDAYGPVNFYLLPFIRPLDVKAYYQNGKNAEIAEHLGNFENTERLEKQGDKEQGPSDSYTDAMEQVIAHMNVNLMERNVLISHQNVTNKGKNKKSESETITIGTVDNIESDVFDAFDYVALGHLHSPQKIGRETIRYCGTPVVYSMSEANDKKSVTVVEFGAEKIPEIRLLPLEQLHKWYSFTGTLEEAVRRDYNLDYARIVLTDREVIIDALAKLRSVYGKLMSMEFQGCETAGISELRTVEEMEAVSPEQAFSDFYKKQKGYELSEENQAYIAKLCKEQEDLRLFASDRYKEDKA